MNATETISFCARSNLNADRVSRYGWGVFYHQDSNFDLSRIVYESRKKAKHVFANVLAAPAIRDRVYRKLIELSPASFNNEIVNGNGGLLQRGIRDHFQYGSLPKTVKERNILTARLSIELAKEYGGDARLFSGIPGFWRDIRGKLRLWSTRDSSEELMLIPFVGAEGLVRACQIRFMRHVRNKSGRYVWLSSSKERTGCGPGSPLHHAAPGSPLQYPVLVTEGALKAATAQVFLTESYVVGSSGVASSHQEIIETARKRPLEIAFDNDSFTNPHVARALAALLRLRSADQKSFAYDDEVRILTWNRSIKGIDEALLAGLKLRSLTCTEWFKRLTPECLEQANRQLSTS